MKNFGEEKLTPRDAEALLNDIKEIEEDYKNYGLRTKDGNGVLDMLPLDELQDIRPTFFKALEKLHQFVDKKGKSVTFQEFWEGLADTGDNTYFKWILSVLKDWGYRGLKSNVGFLADNSKHRQELGIDAYDDNRSGSTEKRRRYSKD